MKIRLIIFTLILGFSASVFAEGDEANWDKIIKNQFFAGRSIDATNSVIELDAPYRAEDPAIVPVKVSSKILQTPGKYIKKIWVFVDNNPFPFVGEFDFFPESGKADLAMRVRVNTYSNIRAIAETSDGKLSMSKKFVKASGGCSAPIGADLDEAMKRLGKVKFRLDEGMQAGQPVQAQLMISHPNITGMQMDQMTRFVRKSHFIDQLKVTFNGQPVLNAKIDIAISADPNFRFYFVPDKPGELKAEFSDISCDSPTSRAVCKSGTSYSQQLTVAP